MLAVEITLMTGRYVATQSNDRDRPEWPPHPARLYSALVAVHHEPDVPDAEERLVLEWFEALGAPSICCTGAPPIRKVVTSFVPVNDATVLRDQGRLYERILEGERALAELPTDAPDTVREKAAATHAKVMAAAAAATLQSTKAPERATAAVAAAATQLLPDHRVRQPRTFPTVVPRDDRVWYLWPDAEPSSIQAAVLDRLLGRIARLGHSSSMVSCRVATDHPAPIYVPDGRGTEPIRVTAPGLLSALEDEYERHRGSEPRALPAAIVPYRFIREHGPLLGGAPKPLLGGRWIVLRRSGPRTLPLRQSLLVARGVRNALMSHAREPVHEALSGHLPGRPGERTPASSSSHLAVVPLPNVGHPHADGGLLGVALVLPRDCSEEGRRAVLQAVRTWQTETGGRLVLGRAGMCRFEPIEGLTTAMGLQRRRWCQPATVWASVTPMALDRHPGDVRTSRPARRQRAEERAREAIVRACSYAGLPEPDDVEIRLDAAWRGVPPTGKFLAFRTERGGGSDGVGGDQLVRCCVHACLRFAEKVAGPVLIGAGRYYGYGLFAPVLGVAPSGLVAEAGVTS